MLTLASLYNGKKKKKIENENENAKGNEEIMAWGRANRKMEQVPFDGIRKADGVGKGAPVAFTRPRAS